MYEVRVVIPPLSLHPRLPGLHARVGGWELHRQGRTVGPRAACARSDVVVMDCQYYAGMPEAPASPSAATLRLVGHVGQVTLDRLQGASVASLADFDQHVAAVRAELTVACQLPSDGAASRAGRAADRRTARKARASRAARAARTAPVPTPPTGTDVSCPDVPFASSALFAAPVLPCILLLHYAC